MAIHEKRLPWRLAFFTLACHMAAPGPAVSAETSSFTVPIVISAPGLAGSHYTSELSLTNRGTTNATVHFTYSAAFGGGSGTATDTLPAGRQRTVPDAIEYLISIGAPIPSSGGRGGVLRVDFSGLSSDDAGSATVRTTTAVSGGRAGLSYAGFGAGIGGTSFLCGLRQDEADRSNVALLNAGPTGAGDVVLRLTVSSGNPSAPASHVLPSLTLSPGAFHQYTEILKTVGLDRGYVRVEVVSGSAPYYAYATILDQSTSDGSFVPPLTEAAAYESSGLTLPVVVETSAFSTEVVLCNLSAAAQTVRLSYVADAVQAPGSTAAVSIVLAAGEQKVIPSLVQYLRSQGVPGVGAPGPVFAGALHAMSDGEGPGAVFLGGRTQTTGGGGRYGLFYTAVAHGTAATSAAWLYGLQQNVENRTNLALVNTGETDSSTIGLRVDLYDGVTGSIARSFDVSLGPRKWSQTNSVLSEAGIANGYARVSRTSGTNPFLAYAVVVDGGAPQQRSDDGAFVGQVAQEPPPSANLIAIRKVEAKCVRLAAEGVSRLEFVRAVATFMATLPEYAASGVDEESFSAYGVFQDGRSHLVANNRDPYSNPQGRSAANDLRGLAVTELPASGWARLLQSFWDWDVPQQPLTDLAAMLEDPGGYAIRVGMVGDARLTALRKVSGDGFLYFNTHGGSAWKTQDLTLRRFYSIQSSTSVTPGSELLAEIQRDQADGLLTYFTATTGGEYIDPVTGTSRDQYDTRYGITADFVRKYWSFAPNSIFFLNACFGADTRHPDGAIAFIDACRSKGAGVYFGWDRASSSNYCYRAVRYFVDRLVGANKVTKENPDQRAFPWELVYDDMKKRGLTHDGDTGAELTPFPGAGGGSVILDPSIRELLVDERNEKLTLKGYFGSRQGKVTVGAKELTGCSWAHDAIVCPLPLTGPGSNGDAFVEVPSELGRTRKSNVHQLTEWKVPLRYVWTDAYGAAPWRVEGSGNLRFRADVGTYRDKPGAAPIHPLRSMVPTKDSSLFLTGSGTVPGDCPSTLSGTIIFQAFTNPYDGSPSILAAAKVDTFDPHLGALGLFLNVSEVGQMFKNTVGPPCGGEFNVPPSFGVLEVSVDFPPPADGWTELPLPALLLTWDRDYRIPATKFIDVSMGGVLTVDLQQAVAPIPAVRLDLAH